MTQCTIPAQAPGTYTVQVTGESARTALGPRQLVVASTGSTSSSCSLLPATSKPLPIVTTDYGQTCTLASDCEIIYTGDPCTPCRCTTAAIAKTYQTNYEGDLRSRTSQCATPPTSTACTPCPSTTAKCVLPDAGGTGTCAVGP
jgi:hypothetical protein